MLSSQKLSKKLRSSVKSANTALNTQAKSAKKGLDQVLVNLEHRGLKIKESQEIIQRMGKKVLDRAEDIRSQIATNAKTPAWLKDMSLINTDLATTLERAGVMKKSSKKKVSMTDKLAATVAANAVIASEAKAVAAQAKAKKSASKNSSKGAQKKLTVKAFKAGKSKAKSYSSNHASK